MAILAPMRGLSYNPQMVPNLTEVVTPPYDVISPQQQEDFYARNPYNMVRLILPRVQPGPGEIENRYERAAADFRKWRQEGVLVRDPEPALYYWETDFTHDNRTWTRHGVVGLLKLEPFESGQVRPHEKTFSAAKDDRFHLIQQCRAHFSTIFALYPDGEDRVMELLRQGRGPRPEIDFEDYAGLRHRSFRITEPEILRAVAREMRERPIFIADGHHRYETSLAIQAWRKEQEPGVSERATFNYVLMYLSNMQDPGMVILPAHRLINTATLRGFAEAALMQALPEYFSVTPLELRPGAVADKAQVVTQALAEAGQQGTALAVATAGGQGVLLRLKPGVMDGPLAAHIPPALAQLDVMALNYLIFEKIMQLTQQQQDDVAVFQYSSTAAGALQALADNRVQLAFLLNPTRIEQVKEVASAGLTMPRKSTYFYPKVPVGMVMHPLELGEEVVF